MLKKLIGLAILFLFLSGIGQAQVTKDSTSVQINNIHRTAIPVAGMTGVPGMYRILYVDDNGALRSPSFDSLKVNIITSVNIDTILIGDSFSFSPVVKANTSIKFRTNKMTIGSWIYLGSGDSIQLDFLISSGDTIFVSSVASVPDVQIIRGRTK